MSIRRFFGYPSPRIKKWIEDHAQQPVPYDARVAYLEGTGTQWIDTGINCVANQRASIRFMFTAELTSSSSSSEYVFGTSLARTSSFHIGRYYNAGYGGIAFSLASYSTHLIANGDCDWHDAVLNSSNGNRHVTFDGVDTADSSTYSPSGTLTMTLFAKRANQTGVQSISHAKIASCQIYDTTTNQLLIDLIPVRKNGVGYMYDRVTGTLLGNAGTGDFLYGADVPFDDEVEWIERHVY